METRAVIHQDVVGGAGHSAPTMRGWKQIPSAPIHSTWICRTLSPDNEGMETTRHPTPRHGNEPGRTLSPDNEGMETDLHPQIKQKLFGAGHSAPTMRGWKRVGG